jgi:hypothetical protein
MRIAVILIFVLSCVTVFANGLEQLLPASKPDIVQGQAIYNASCSQCHTTTAFAERSWKSSLTPASLAFGLHNSSHGENLEPADLWHVTAYVWTQSATGSHIKHGEALAFEAEKRMKSDALWLFLTKGNDMMNLQNRDWVLSHTEADIDSVITGLAGDDYVALPATDKAALIDYIYASYFTWPESWSLE